MNEPAKIRLSNGYTFNRVITGCWQLSKEHSLTGPLDLNDVLAGFQELVANGFTTFDCADIYTGVEELIGRFVDRLKSCGPYQETDIQVHTKFVPDKKMLAKVDRAYVERIVDRSLMRMHRSSIDLIQFHWWDFNVAGMVDTAYELVRLQKKGKIRNLGLCNMDTDRVKQLVDAGINVVSNQAQYSLLDRRLERSLLNYSAAHNIYTFAYGTVAGGFLSAKYLGRALGMPETRSQVKYRQILADSLGAAGLQKLLRLLKKIAERHQVSVVNVAVQYILRQPGVGAVMVGIRNSQHVQDNLRTLRFELTPAEMQAIHDFLAQCPTPQGECYELERTAPRYQRIIMTDLDQ